jgi:quinol monooxygenase YgiN
LKGWLAASHPVNLTLLLTLARYQNQQALKEHGSSKVFTAFNKQLGEKDLMRAPMMLKMVSQTGGFSSRL